MCDHPISFWANTRIGSFHILAFLEFLWFFDFWCIGKLLCVTPHKMRLEIFHQNSWYREKLKWHIRLYWYIQIHFQHIRCDIYNHIYHQDQCNRHDDHICDSPLKQFSKVVDQQGTGYIDVGDRCWRLNLLVTFLKMLVTVLAVLVTNIDYLFTLAKARTFKRCHQLHGVTKINVARETFYLNIRWYYAGVQILIQ